MGRESRLAKHQAASGRYVVSLRARSFEASKMYRIKTPGVSWFWVNATLPPCHALPCRSVPWTAIRQESGGKFCFPLFVGVFPRNEIRKEKDDCHLKEYVAHECI